MGKATELHQVLTEKYNTDLFVLGEHADKKDNAIYVQIPCPLAAADGRALFSSRHAPEDYECGVHPELVAIVFDYQKGWMVEIGSEVLIYKGTKSY